MTGISTRRGSVGGLPREGAALRLVAGRGVSGFRIGSGFMTDCWGPGGVWFGKLKVGVALEILTWGNAFPVHLIRPLSGIRSCTLSWGLVVKRNWGV